MNVKDPEVYSSKSWVLTPELRRKTVNHYGWGVDPGNEGERVLIMQCITLQQAWHCVETGEVEWRDIPEITETTESDPLVSIGGSQHEHK